MRIAVLALSLLSGCAAVGVEAGAQSIDYVIGETTHEVAHACDGSGVLPARKKR